MHKRVIFHLVPKMQIGGVEIAIQKSYTALNEVFDYNVLYLQSKGQINVGQQHILWTVLNLVRNKNKRPDVIVTSLWKSHLFGIIFKVFGIKWVAFFHNSNFAHLFDCIFQRIGWLFADYRFVDSKTTGKYLDKRKLNNYTIIPYLFNVLDVSEIGGRDIDLIWVGRDSFQKRVDLLIKFLNVLDTKDVPLKVNIIIANSGKSNTFSKCYKNITLAINNSVTNVEVIKFLKRSKFYIQFSDYEGMSMTTVEAIQCGALPAVRIVGEMSDYLNSTCCLTLDEISDDSLNIFCERIVSLSQNDDLRVELSEKCLKSLNNYKDYISAFKTSIFDIIK